MLRDRLRQPSPDLVALLHRRAAEWYAAHDYAAEAADHQRRAEQPDPIGELDDQHRVPINGAALKLANVQFSGGDAWVQTQETNAFVYRIEGLHKHHPITATGRFAKLATAPKEITLTERATFSWSVQGRKESGKSNVPLALKPYYALDVTAFATEDLAIGTAQPIADRFDRSPGHGSLRGIFTVERNDGGDPRIRDHTARNQHPRPDQANGSRHPNDGRCDDLCDAPRCLTLRSADHHLDL